MDISALVEAGWELEYSEAAELAGWVLITPDGYRDQYGRPVRYIGSHGSVGDQPGALIGFFSEWDAWEAAEDRQETWEERVFNDVMDGPVDPADRDYGESWEDCYNEEGGYWEWEEEVEVGEIVELEADGPEIVAEFESSGNLFVVQADGRLFLRVERDHYSALVAVDEKLRELLFREQCPSWLERIDLSDAMPRAAWLKGVRDKLVGQSSGNEAVAYMFRGRDGDWQAVVPEQKVSGASWEIKDQEAMFQYWKKRGYSSAGHLHLHPGKGNVASDTDHEDWAKMRGGIFVVAGERAEEFGVYFHCHEVCWSLDKVDVSGCVAEDVTLLGKEGEVDWGKLIVVPKQRTGKKYTHKPTSWQQNRTKKSAPAWWDDDSAEKSSGHEVAISLENADVVVTKEGKMVIVGLVTYMSESEMGKKNRCSLIDFFGKDK